MSLNLGWLITGKLAHFDECEGFVGQANINPKTEVDSGNVWR